MSGVKCAVECTRCFPGCNSLRRDTLDWHLPSLQPRLEAIRFLSAAIKAREIEMRSEAPDKVLSDEDAIKVSISCTTTIPSNLVVYSRL